MNWSKTRVTSLLKELDLKPNKLRGQNFLFDNYAIEVILQFAAVKPGDLVLEIGPGLGVLSESLNDITTNYSFVEIEEKFADALHARLNLEDSQVVCRDIREVELKTKTSKYQVVSNVPYSISSEVILWTINQHVHISSACLLLQREFAERIAANPGERKCGSLSVLRSIYAEASLGEVISGDSFFPQARVESRLLELSFRETPLFPHINKLQFEKLVRACFSHRRKTILNSLADCKYNELSKEQLLGSINAAKVNSKLRAEALTLQQFVDLYEAFEAYNSTLLS